MDSRFVCTPSIGAAVVGLASLAWSPVQASDVKVYPGTMCQVGELSNIEQIVYDFEGSVTNVDPDSSLQVLCPIVRDSARRSIRSAAVEIEKADNVGFLCSLQSRQASGELVDQEDQSDFGFAGLATIEFGRLATRAFGYYVLNCFIPPEHTLISYRADEFAE